MLVRVIHRDVQDERQRYTNGYIPVKPLRVMIGFKPKRNVLRCAAEQGNRYGIRKPNPQRAHIRREQLRFYYGIDGSIAAYNYQRT